MESFEEKVLLAIGRIEGQMSFVNKASSIEKARWLGNLGFYTLRDQIGTIGAFGSSRCRSSGSLVTMVS